MTQDTLKIKCPNCGAVLTVKNVPNIETKSVPCPICKQKAPFTRFKVLNLNQDARTAVPGGGWTPGGEHTINLMSQGAAPGGSNMTIGTLVMPATGMRFPLKPGLNILGRNAQSSSATIKLNTGQSMRMSREHMVINVEQTPGKGYVHSAKLYKQQVNDTYVNNDKLSFGDCVVLKDGDRIKLPDMELVFSIGSIEKTQF